MIKAEETDFSQADLKFWESMVDELKGQLGPGAIVIDNGFFLAGKYPHNKQLAGADAWVHTGTSYAESMSSIGDGAGNAFKRHLLVKPTF